MNHLLTSTGITVIENKIIEHNTGWFNKETNQLFVENIYPFVFLGCGVLYSIEQCVDFAMEYAIGKINKKINSYE